MALATAMVCLLGFTSCDDDPEALAGLIEQSDLIGHINLVASNPQNGNPVDITIGDTLKFKSALCNVSIDTLRYDSIEVTSVEMGTIMVGTTDNIITGDVAEITYPLVGIHLNRAAVGTYTISCPIESFDFFKYLDSTDVNQMITSGITFGNEMGNLFAMAVSEDGYYIGYMGNIRINEFGEEGSLVKGNVNNVVAIYVTRQQIEEMANMTADQQAGINLATYFPSVTFNGVISSRRANMEAIITALEAEEE